MTTAREAPRKVIGVTTPIRVLIVDDDALVRAGLSMMLSGAEDIAVVADVADGSEVIPAVNEHRPDVVLMDIRMPRLDGLAATERLRARRDPPEVIILTTFDTDDHILRAMRAGASGFLLKHTPPPDIVRAIRQVAAGEPMLSPAVLRRMMAYVAEAAGVDPRQARARALLDRLSDGERAVALLVGQGKTNGEIGRELSLSVATVKAYVSRLLTKLDLNNRVQIALLVHDAGLADPS
ncbi:DNA-binding response regulator [Actinomadura sp. NBRC 104425]|nr:DNA-binding response regulator [Actinomadura sp. NBRC 104425]